MKGKTIKELASDLLEKLNQKDQELTNEEYNLAISLTDFFRQSKLIDSKQLNPSQNETKSPQDLTANAKRV